MSSLTIRIETNNAAFADNLEAEVARILRKFCDEIEAGQLQYNRFIDQNGNEVGAATYAGITQKCSCCDQLDPDQHEYCCRCGLMICGDCVVWRDNGKPLCPDCSVG